MLSCDGMAGPAAALAIVDEYPCVDRDPLDSVLVRSARNMMIPPPVPFSIHNDRSVAAPALPIWIPAVAKVVPVATFHGEPGSAPKSS